MKVLVLVVLVAVVAGFIAAHSFRSEFSGAAYPLYIPQPQSAEIVPTPQIPSGGSPRNPNYVPPSAEATGTSSSNSVDFHGPSGPPHMTGPSGPPPGA